MGMFDEVKVLAALPDDRVAPGKMFQTKDLGSCMVQFTITAEGRLIHNKHYYEQDGEREIRGGVRLPNYKLVRVEDIDMDYHGDVLLYAPGKDGKLAEYVARFTHGTVEWIRPYHGADDADNRWRYTRDW